MAVGQPDDPPDGVCSSVTRSATGYSILVMDYQQQVILDSFEGFKDPGHYLIARSRLKYAFLVRVKSPLRLVNPNPVPRATFAACSWQHCRTSAGRKPSRFLCRSVKQVPGINEANYERWRTTIPRFSKANTTTPCGLPARGPRSWAGISQRFQRIRRVPGAMIFPW